MQKISKLNPHFSKESLSLMYIKNTVYLCIFKVIVPTFKVILTLFQLFDHIASCIAAFMKEHNLENERLPLGFTFSFPCKQEGLNVGRLVSWTKGFKCEGVEGKDVVQLLHDAIKRRGVRMQCIYLFLF